MYRNVLQELIKSWKNKDNFQPQIDLSKEECAFYLAVTQEKPNPWSKILHEHWPEEFDSEGNSTVNHV